MHRPGRSRTIGLFVSVSRFGLPEAPPQRVLAARENFPFSESVAITVENHSIIGGLGSAICETLAAQLPSKVYRIGINDEFGQSGKAEELMKHYGLDSETLAKKIKTIIKNEKEQDNI